jgi:UDP:flavonoid glycosyltransferase YjiC (YdhE family)
MNLFDRSGTEGLPRWTLALPRERPVVYASLGTEPALNGRSDVFAAIITALRDEPVELVVTVGRNQDPAQFGPQPPSVHVER